MAFPPEAGKAHRFKPGHPGGPGRPKGIIRADDVKALMGRFWNMTRDDLRSVVENQKSTMGEIMVASVMAKAAKDGDYARLSFLLDRAIGRAKVEDEEDQGRPDLTPETREKLIAVLRAIGSGAA